MTDSVVVDSSVAIKWFVIEPYSTEAQRLLNDYQTGALNLLAPDLIYAELGNIAWKKHRFQGLALADAQQILQVFANYQLVVTPSASLVGDAFQLAVTHQRSVYDMMYVALSSREKCRLVTADEKLVNALSPSFPNLVAVATWP